MVYIIVGCDCTGKSTAFNLLKTMHESKNMVFIKESRTTDESAKLYRVRRVANFAESKVNVVYDRATIIDDFVYNEIIDGRQSMLPKEEVMEVLQNCKVIYFECADDELKARLDFRGDEFVTLNQLRAIKARYEEVFTEFHIEPLRIDTTNMRIHEVHNALDNIICKKAPRIAHIVPLGSLDKIAKKQYHMCLAHLIAESEEYAKKYAYIREEHETYLLMDNGAAENSQLCNEELLECYYKVVPDEMVLPDVLLQKDATFESTMKGLRYFKYEQQLPCKFMVVPQGETLEEWAECAEALIQCEDINSFGVSKFLSIATGDANVRYKACSILEQLIAQYGRYDLEVHLLGCQDAPARVKEIFDDFDFVRGCDSAIGYLYAQADVEVQDETLRPEGEIDFLGGSDYVTLENTLQAFEIATGVVYGGKDLTWQY